MLFDELTELVAISRSRTLAEAAEKLGISRATLVRHLDALEMELGWPLLSSKVDDVCFTKQGLLALDAAREVEALEAGLLSDYAKGESDSGTCRRDVIVSVPCELPDLFGVLHDAASDVSATLHLDVQRLDADNALRNLRRNTADVVIVLDAQLDTTRLDGSLCVESLVETGTCVSLPADSRLGDRGTLTLRDLSEEVFLRPCAEDVADRSAWDAFMAACLKEGIDPLFRCARVSNQPPSSREVAVRANGRAAHGDESRVLVPIAGLDLSVYAVFRSCDAEIAQFIQSARLLAEARERRAAIGFAKLFGGNSKTPSASPQRHPSAVERVSALELVTNEPNVTHDLVLPDDTVVDKAYVALRNRLNRIGEGVGNEPVASSYEAIMHLWSVEEAQAYLQMPMFGTFTAYDYAVSTGRLREEAERILEGFADKSLVMRFDRGGVRRYSLLSWHEIWEASVARYTPESIAWGITGSDLASVSSYPIYHVCPVSPDVVEGHAMAPYRDWRAYVASQSQICVAPCQCRKVQAIKSGQNDARDEYDDCCLMFGEMAQFWESIGVGRKVSTDEALEIARRNVFEGAAIPEFSFSKNPEILCFCRSEYCVPLAAVRETLGDTPIMPNISAYRLVFDAATCSGCGACVDRCPMHVIDGHGAPVLPSHSACVACGQCAYVCPTGARRLVMKERGEICEPPQSMIEGNAWRSAERMARGNIVDFVDARLKE